MPQGNCNKGNLPLGKGKGRKHSPSAGKEMHSVAQRPCQPKEVLTSHPHPLMVPATSLGAGLLIWEEDTTARNLHHPTAYITPVNKNLLQNWPPQGRNDSNALKALKCWLLWTVPCKFNGASRRACTDTLTDWELAITHANEWPHGEQPEYSHSQAYPWVLCRAFVHIECKTPQLTETWVSLGILVHTWLQQAAVIH